MSQCNRYTIRTTNVWTKVHVCPSIQGCFIYWTTQWILMTFGMGCQTGGWTTFHSWPRQIKPHIQQNWIIPTKMRAFTVYMESITLSFIYTKCLIMKTSVTFCYRSSTTDVFAINGTTYSEWHKKIIKMHLGTVVCHSYFHLQQVSKFINYSVDTVSWHGNSFATEMFLHYPLELQRSLKTEFPINFAFLCNLW